MATPEVEACFKKHMMKITAMWTKFCRGTVEKGKMKQDALDNIVKTYGLVDAALTRKEVVMAYILARDPNSLNLTIKWASFLEWLARLADLKFAEDDVYADTPEQMCIHLKLLFKFMKF
jgi:hypothetical protein